MISIDSLLARNAELETKLARLRERLTTQLAIIRALGQPQGLHEARKQMRELPLEDQWSAAGFDLLKPACALCLQDYYHYPAPAKCQEHQNGL